MKPYVTIPLAGLAALFLASLAFAYLARPDAASTAPTAGDSVAIRNFGFQPATLSVVPGTTVTWVNEDPVVHTVTGDGGSWGSGLLAQGQEFSYTFTEAGTYTYFCQPHPVMRGTVVVVETAGDTASGSPTREATPAAPDDEAPPRGAPPAGDGWRDQMRGWMGQMHGGWSDAMREWMDQMHGAGAFDAMRQWMEERWGPGAFEDMIENCPRGGTGGGMMGGSPW